MGPDALGLWDLTRWVNDGLLMPFSLESNAKLPGKPHLEKRPRSFGKMNTVFWENEHGLFGERPRSFLQMTAVGLATQGMPRRQGHARCALAEVLVRTICRFGAHHLSLWCAPFVALVRTKTAGDAHQNSQDSATKPGNVREKANSPHFPASYLRLLRQFARCNAFWRHLA
jgi:hypothetical protein